MKKEVVRLSKRLPELSEYQIEWAKKNCHKKYAFFKTYKKRTKCYCSECGKPFYVDNGTMLYHNLEKEGIECPHCHSELLSHSGWVRKDSWYFTKFSICKGYQVIRHFISSNYFKRNEAASCYIYEAVQVWISPSGDEIIRSLPKDFFGRWRVGEEMIFRRRSLNYDTDYDINSYFNCPNQRIIPELKRNGIKYFKEQGNITSNKLFCAILKEPIAEILLKNKQYDLLKDWCYGYKNKINKYMQQIKICNRHKYVVKSSNLWLDHIEMLERNHFDIHNPKFICPNNLNEEHHKIIEIDQKRRHKESIKEIFTKPEYISDNEQYIRSKEKFFELLFSDKDIWITPLKSVWEFKKEGDYMHHCVFSNKYYKKDNSLILSAVNADSKLETIEVSLINFSIVQARGRFNQSSPFHDRIVKMVNDNMNLIKAAAC